MRWSTAVAAAVDAQQVLSAGIRDVTETLTSDFALNDVLQMVLETMYRGMGFSRTMIFVRDAQAEYHARPLRLRRRHRTHHSEMQLPDAVRPGCVSRGAG